MLIEFQKLRFKNISSYGNNFTEFTFQDGLNLITAPNGSGKSSILEALTFVLYGKPYRDIKIEQLINDTNGSKMLVEVFFKKGQDKYHIVRGLKPGIFEIKINDQSIDMLPNKSSNQEEIDRIIGLNYHLFKQIIALSTLNNKPFLALPLPEKRNVTESVFNIKVFSKMLKKLKKNRTALETSVEINDRELALMKENLTGLANQIKSLRKAKDDFEVEKQKEIDDVKANIAEIQKEIDWFANELAANDPYAAELDLSVEESLKTKMGELVSEKIQLSTDKDNLRKNLERDLKIKVAALDLDLQSITDKILKANENPLLDRSYVARNSEEVLERKKIITTNEDEIRRLRLELTRLAEGGGVCDHCLQAVPENHRETETAIRNARKQELESENKNLEDEIERIVSEKVANAKKENQTTILEFRKISEEIRQKKIDFKFECDNEIAAQTTSLEKKIAALLKKIKTVDIQICDIAEKKTEIIRKRMEYEMAKSKQENRKKNLHNLENSLEKIKVKEFSIDTDSLVTDFEKRKGNYQDLMAKTKDMKKKLNVTEVIKNILDEEGIKKYFFSRLIPKLNTSINEYLDFFELPLNFEFDETFAETIKEFGDKTKSYFQFSNGEQYRINLAIILSFMDLNRLINSFDCNILFFDELLDNAVDGTGMELVLEKLHDLSESRKTSIYIISHKEIENSVFIDNTIKIRKVNGFSRIL